MARQCEVCGKSRQLGNQVTTRGKKKYLGGVGTKVTGIARRKFKPNLQRVKVQDENGNVRTIRVAVSVIRSGMVKKPVKRKPFQVTNV
jgi:large subunit ribosomal protein L28